MIRNRLEQNTKQNQTQNNTQPIQLEFGIPSGRR